MKINLSVHLEIKTQDKITIQKRINKLFLGVFMC